MKMKKHLRCPYCKHTEFGRATKELVEIFTDGSDFVDEVIDNCGIYYVCFGCGQDVEVSELKEVEVESTSSCSHVQVKGGGEDGNAKWS